MNIHSTGMLIRRGNNLLKANYRLLCQQFNDPIQSFRTIESNPIKHDISNSGQFYSLPNSTIQNLFKHGGLPRSFKTQTKTFTETCIMVRNPALEVIDILKKYDPSKPAFKFVLYGFRGSGKSITLAHLLHYAHESGYMIVHVPWVPDWVRRTVLHRETAGSMTHEGLVDLPLDAANWLIHFKSQNLGILKKKDLLTSNEYIWSKRESVPAGSTLLELIDLGINRVKYASDTILALMDELKNASTQNLCKTFVAIDGFNSFYTSLSKQKYNRRKITPKEMSLTTAFLNITKNDWSNGAIVVVADQMATRENFDSYHPKYLLGRDGFEHLDPFIPIEVKDYSDKEFISCMNYYRDRLWVRDHPDAETELAFTSGKNPYKLMKYCAPL